jgi:asparagine synthase (glutamine-hydrolysing)
MSGIVGIYNLDGRPVEQTDIKRMVDSIAHRGPDGSGIWTDGSVGLGHQMLWTTPESLQEKLPLTNKTGELTITADARIDNRDELIPVLNLNGRPRETIPDSEIILAAYEKWGEQCPEKLLGDFAFAIRDKRRQRIYCARDPIGIKPFYYFCNGKAFRWASEPRPIFEDRTISKEPNLPLMCLYLLNRFDEREETLYKDIYRLPPSHFMVLENGHIKKGQYWDIDPNYAIRYKTDKEYAERFLELFKEAIRARLRSHGPIGAFLSGGLDSSSIVCTAQMLYKEEPIVNKGFQTFSKIFNKFPCDERIYIKEVVNKWNIEVNYVLYETTLSDMDFEQVQHFPDVGYFASLFSNGPLLKKAQEKGIRVMLDGVGGDDLLAAGFDHLTDLFLQGKILKLITQLRTDANFFTRSPYTLFFNYCFKPILPKSLKTIFKIVFKPSNRNGIPSWINTSYLKSSGVEETIGKTENLKKFPTHSQQHIYDLLYNGWETNIVEDIEERFNAYFNIISRRPFFDRRLLEFAFALPEEQRFSLKWPKEVLRRSMENILPENIRWRKGKADFSNTVDEELRCRQSDKLKALFQRPFLAESGIVHLNELKQFLGKYQHGIGKGALLPTLEILVWLELWCRSIMVSNWGR